MTRQYTYDAEESEDTDKEEMHESLLVDMDHNTNTGGGDNTSNAGPTNASSNFQSSSIFFTLHRSTS